MANRDENVSLDVLYAPSAWSTRLSSDVIVDKHIEVLREGETAHCPILLKSETSQLICSFSNSAGTRPAEVWAEHSVWCREWTAAGYLLPQPSSCNCRTGYSHVTIINFYGRSHCMCNVLYTIGCGLHWALNIRSSFFQTSSELSFLSVVCMLASTLSISYIITG